MGRLSEGQIIELPVKDLAGPSEESHVVRNRVEGRGYRRLTGRIDVDWAVGDGGRHPWTIEAILPLLAGRTTAPRTAPEEPPRTVWSDCSDFSYAFAHSGRSYPEIRCVDGGYADG